MDEAPQKKKTQMKKTKGVNRTFDRVGKLVLETVRKGGRLNLKEIIRATVLPLDEFGEELPSEYVVTETLHFLVHGFPPLEVDGKLVNYKDGRYSVRK